MSGHSKWSTIKHKKAAADAKRGKVFSRISKELSIAAKQGGGDLDTNARLRTVIASAKAVNMPSDNIDRAIKKGTGELPGVSYEELTYEGYGPAGVAIMVRCLTDNKNRTAAEIRSIFTKKGGSLGGAGSVAWMFARKGFFSVPANSTSEDDLFMVVSEAGAEDLKLEGDMFEITCSPEDFVTVKDALDEAGVKYEEAEVTHLPENTVMVDGKDAETTMKLIDALEEQDDVQNLSSNFDISDETMEKLNS